MNDRETFEATIFKPPHLARMLERFGEFTGRLDSADREFFLTSAVDRLYERREEIKTSNDVEQLWVSVLTDVAFTRPRWHVAVGHWGVAVGKEWVKSIHLRKYT